MGLLFFCSEGDVFCALESGAFTAEEKTKMIRKILRKIF